MTFFFRFDALQAVNDTQCLFNSQRNNLILRLCSHRQHSSIICVRTAALIVSPCTVFLWQVLHLYLSCMLSSKNLVCAAFKEKDRKLSAWKLSLLTVRYIYVHICINECVKLMVCIRIKKRADYKSQDWVSNQFILNSEELPCYSHTSWVQVFLLTINKFK